MSEVKLNYDGKGIEVGNIHEGIDSRGCSLVIAEDASNGDLYLKVGDEPWVYMEWKRMYNSQEKEYEVCT